MHWLENRKVLVTAGEYAGKVVSVLAWSDDGKEIMFEDSFGDVHSIPSKHFKIVVEYDDKHPQYRPYIKVGDRGSVWGINHYRLGTQWIDTSTVLQHDAWSGEFETEYSYYIPTKKV